MAVDKITFADKVSMIESTLPVINRIRDIDVNEIKDVVNNNADELENIIPTKIENSSFSNISGTISSNGSCKIGDVISLNLGFTGVSGSSGTKVVAKIAEGLYPTGYTPGIFAQVNGTSVNGWIRNSSGEICVAFPSSLTSTEVKILTTYML